MKELQYLNKYFYKYRWRFLLGVFFVAISNFFRILQPQVIRHALDLVIANVSVYDLYNGFLIQDSLYEQIGLQLLMFGGLAVLFALLMGVFMYFMRQTLIVMSRLIEFDLRNEIFGHYEKLSLAFYKRNNTGDLMARITEDVSKVRMYIGPAVMYGVNLTILCVMVISAMVRVSPTLTFYALLPLPVLSFSIYYVTSIINKKSEMIQAQLSTLNSLSQEVYSGVRVVKSYVKEDSMRTFFEEEAEEFKSRSMSLAKVDALFRPVMLLLIGFSTIITIYVGGILVLDGSITAGNIAEFVIYINMLTWPVTSIGWVASIVQRAAASQKRINEFLKTVPDIRDEPETIDERLTGEIQFDNVTFDYPDTGVRALENVSFTLKPGERLAIIGRTGSGKTTMADLLLRMYDTTEGAIKLNGKTIKEHKLASVRSNIGYVPQDVFLFSDSIHNNIAFSKKGAERSEVEQFAKNASVYEDIMSLSENFDTVVGERGVTLSGGQKQRISIARALIKEPDILILDDCLSAVDTKTEAAITGYLNTAYADKTTIIITHRLYASVQFDKIIVLDNGRVVEEGTHSSLMEERGYYYKVFEQQRLEEVE